MASNRRERELERARHERQQSRRAAARARARRRGQVIASAVAVLVVIGGVFGLNAALRDDAPSALPVGQTTPEPDPALTPDPAETVPDPGASATAAPATPATPVPTASPTASSTESSTGAAGPCAYAPTEGEPAARDVGVPTYDAAGAKRPYTATLATSQGTIEFEALTAQAPCTANSFRFLAQKKYFDGTTCHRLTTEGIFVLQCGDPTGTGSGGPGYGFGVENTPPDGTYPAGTVAMARTSDPNSNGSQFFLVYDDSTIQDPTGYTVFGRVTKGLDVLKKVAEAGVAEGGGDGAPKTPVEVSSVTVRQ